LLTSKKRKYLGGGMAAHLSKQRKSCESRKEDSTKSWGGKEKILLIQRGMLLRTRTEKKRHKK